MYEIAGHDKECMGYEDHMYELAEKWVDEKPILAFKPGRSYQHNETWKIRYDLIVKFLLRELKLIKKNQVQID